MDEPTSLLISLVAFGIALAVLFAQLRLFSIDETLKAILRELRAQREVSSAQAQGTKPPEPPKDIWEDRAKRGS